MSVQRIPLETVQKVRQYIQGSLVLPEAENQPQPWTAYSEVNDLPEPESLGELGSMFNFGGALEEHRYVPNDRGEWFVSSANPAAPLLRLPGIRLKLNMRLISYLYRIPGEGVGIVWAVPESFSTTAHLEKALPQSDSRTTPPHPDGAMPDLMDAIEGDRTPVSFLVASVLRRELREFGAVGKARNWGHHRLITQVPNQVRWTWQTPNPPKDLSPKVKIFPDGKAAIEFFTCRVVAPFTLFQHVDQYPAHHYKPVSIDRPIAAAAQPQSASRS
jgi:hypothetical protein